MYADSAYRSAKISALLEQKKLRDRIHRKGYRNTPLSERSREANRKKSKTRARAEHVFGWMERRTQGTWMHAVGLMRMSVKIGLRNLAYNLDRFACLTKMALAI